MLILEEKPFARLMSDDEERQVVEEKEVYKEMRGATVMEPKSG